MQHVVLNYCMTISFILSPRNVDTDKKYNIPISYLRSRLLLKNSRSKFFEQTIDQKNAKIDPYQSTQNGLFSRMQLFQK